MSDDTNEGVTIRAARLSDLAAINDLYLEYSDQLENPTQRPGDNPSLLAWQMKRLRQNLMANQAYFPFLIQRPDQTLAGYCAALIKENSPAFAVQVYADISEFHVTDGDDRREMAQQLLETVLGFLDNRGIKAVLSTTSDDLVESVLTSLGFSGVSKVFYRGADAEGKQENDHQENDQQESVQQERDQQERDQQERDQQESDQQESDQRELDDHSS